MKSSNTSFPLRRAILAMAVIATTGAGVAFAQSSMSPNSTSSSSTDNTSNYNSTANTSNSSNSSMNSPSDTNMANNSSSSSSSKLDWSDRRFLNKVAKGNEDEIKIAQLATDRASSPDVKNFAQQLVTDHQKLATDLETLASNKNVDLKGEQKEKEKESHEYKRLSNASGNDFDKQFVEHMVSEHKKDVKEFQARSNDAKDPDVKSFAQTQLPTLQHHLELAQQLQQSIVPTGRSGNAANSNYNSSSSSNTSNNVSSGTSGYSPNTPTTTGGTSTSATSSHQ